MGVVVEHNLDQQMVVVVAAIRLVVLLILPPEETVVAAEVGLGLRLVALALPVQGVFLLAVAGLAVISMVVVKER